jgi:twinkle protein
MTILDKLQNLDIDLKNKVTGSIVTVCPQCSELRKKKKQPCLSVDIDQGLYNCHHCGWTGKVFLDDDKTYKVPEVNNTDLNDKALKWINDVRGISKATAIRFKLFSEGHEIGFPYIENGKIVHVKYRNAKKVFRSSAGTKLIAFGMHLDFNETLIITEGEFDALSFYEAGYSAISCSNGAESFTWLDNCYKWVDQFEKIIIAYDNDEKGIKGREELSRRLGRERCYKFTYPEGFKDANEMLLACKTQENWKEVFKYYFKYEPFPIDGIISVNDLRERIFDLRKKGFPQGETTGFPNLDSLMSWAPGQLTVITGVPSHGKSEFIDQLMIRLKHLNWLIFSPENVPEEAHLSKLIEKNGKKPFFKMNNQELSNQMDDLEKCFTFCDIEEIKTIDEIMSLTKQAVLSKGVKGVLVDPYSRIEHNYAGKQTETEYVRKILDSLSSMARHLQVHIILVAHPTKMQKDEVGNYIVPNLYSISGSAHFFNTADNGITVYRRKQQDGGQDKTEIHVQKVRFKWVGQTGLAGFDWEKETGNYTPIENYGKK